MKPGLYDNIPAEQYHADPCPAPSLSSGVARTIINRSLRHAWLEHPKLGGKNEEATPAMDLGGLVHAILAGEEKQSYEVGNFDDFKTKAARTWRESVNQTGRTAVLQHVYDEAAPIAAVVREKAGQGLSIDPFSAGHPEVTALWQEEGAWFRARYDRLILDPTGYADIWDWKTTNSVAPDRLVRTIIDEGYHFQAAHYLRGLRALKPEFAGRVSFIFGFVEVEPPYAFRRVVLSEGFVTIGDAEIARAFAAWKQALATNHWPDGCADTMKIQPPAWYVHKFTEGLS